MHKNERKEKEKSRKKIECAISHVPQNFVYLL